MNDSNYNKKLTDELESTQASVSEDVQSLLNDYLGVPQDIQSLITDYLGSRERARRKRKLKKKKST